MPNLFRYEGGGGAGASGSDLVERAPGKSRARVRGDRGAAGADRRATGSDRGVGVSGVASPGGPGTADQRVETGRRAAAPAVSGHAGRNRRVTHRTQRLARLGVGDGTCPATRRCGGIVTKPSSDPASDSPIEAFLDELVVGMSTRRPRRLRHLVQETEAHLRDDAARSASSRRWASVSWTRCRSRRGRRVDIPTTSSSRNASMGLSDAGSLLGSVTMPPRRRVAGRAPSPTPRHASRCVRCVTRRSLPASPDTAAAGVRRPVSTRWSAIPAPPGDATPDTPTPRSDPVARRSAPAAPRSPRTRALDFPGARSTRSDPDAPAPPPPSYLNRLGIAADHRNTETAETGVEGNIPFVIGVVAAAAEDGKPDRCRRVYLRPPRCPF